MRTVKTLALLLMLTASLSAQHHPGEGCVDCHANLALGGTVFVSNDGGGTSEGAAISLVREDGSRIILPASDGDGRIFSPSLDSGRYLMRLGAIRSRSWHTLPAQRNCNSCHIPGGNPEGMRSKRLPSLHTEIPADNSCLPCHHYPASMNLAQLVTPGTLNATAIRPATQSSAVVIRGNTYTFDPADYRIQTLRPDIFAEGHYSLFDVLIAVARRNGHSVALHWDADCMTHFIDSVDGIAGDFWYHFSYDAGSGTANELQHRRQIRWDELLYQPGAWVRLVVGEAVSELKQEYREEIQRQRQYGHMIPQVRIAINPSNYHGNPPESNRITVTRNWRDVTVSAHDLRAEGSDSLYRSPFQPGVVTAMDVLFSLRAQGLLDVVGTAYFTHLAGKVMESYRVRSLGFPDAGLAHASGRQGFVYTTGNGSFTRLANDADAKQHVHADIHVIHAPDFAVWRWIELGNPFYETETPTGLDEVLADYEARDRGFRLQRPWPQPSSAAVNISCNIFEAGSFVIDIVDVAGRRIALLHDGPIDHVGVHRFIWEEGRDCISSE
ncbi:MAG: hypothetical protein M5R41_15100 [Bacteroidia bacterium]|nr:hypothetical protein [Bacteroidia bacterium]